MKDARNALEINYSIMLIYRQNGIAKGDDFICAH